MLKNMAGLLMFVVLIGIVPNTYAQAAQVDDMKLFREARAKEFQAIKSLFVEVKNPALLKYFNDTLHTKVLPNMEGTLSKPPKITVVEAIVGGFRMYASGDMIVGLYYACQMDSEDVLVERLGHEVTHYKNNDEWLLELLNRKQQTQLSKMMESNTYSREVQNHFDNERDVLYFTIQLKADAGGTLIANRGGFMIDSKDQYLRLHGTDVESLQRASLIMSTQDQFLQSCPSCKISVHPRAEILNRVCRQYKYN